MRPQRSTAKLRQQEREAAGWLPSETITIEEDDETNPEEPSVNKETREEIADESQISKQQSNSVHNAMKKKADNKAMEDYRNKFRSDASVL